MNPFNNSRSGDSCPSVWVDLFNSLVDAIYCALKTPDAILDAAQSHVLEHHDLESMINRTANFYSKLLKEKGYVI